MQVFAVLAGGKRTICRWRVCQDGAWRLWVYTHKLPSDDELGWGDYVGWHKHRPHFGLWYIEIHHQEIWRYCQLKQTQFHHFLNPNYHRQFHITLFVNGFWQPQKTHDDDFTPNDLNEQIGILKKLTLMPFELTLENLHTFDNCLSIKIKENEQLNLIRKYLSNTHHEIAPTHYIPHITLGFYQDNFLKQTILDKIHRQEFQELSFLVNKLTFGYYHALQLQGELTPIYQHHLQRVS